MIDFQCVQMAEQNRRAGKQRGSDWETGQKSQLIRDGCRHVLKKQKNKKKTPIYFTEAGPRYDSSKSSSNPKHLF